MSAPLVVNTTDGTCWTRRTVTSGGIALYAPERVRTCPEFVMATLPELAEHGIVGSADALPMPVAEVPQARTTLDRARDAVDARMSKDALRHVLKNVIAYAAELERQRNAFRDQRNNIVATNEQLHARTEESGRARLRAENETRTVKRQFAEAAATVADLVQKRGERMKVEHALRDEVEELRARVAELEAAPRTVYRASHDSIVMGLYTTAAEARKHCETLIRRDIPGAALDWIEDEEDGVAELVAAFGEDERSTGYVVTPLEVAAEYDPDGDE